MAPQWLSNSSLNKHIASLRATPHEVIANRHIITTTLLFGTCAVMMSWDQGMAGSAPSLPGFQRHFHLSSGSNAEAIQNFISYPYLGYMIGCALSYLFNDRFGRKWSLRGFVVVYMAGQLIAIFSSKSSTLYASRIVTGTGIGGFTVIGPMTLSEIAPTEIRGLITSLYVVFMNLSVFAAALTVYGIYETMAPTKLQFQVLFIVPLVYSFLIAVASFFTCDSPRWLLIVDRPDDALKNLSLLRGLPEGHPRVLQELEDIRFGLPKEKRSLLSLAKETLSTRTNLRRVQQTLVAYALAQLSGANSITSYFIPIMTLISPVDSTSQKIFTTGMYSFSKVWFGLIAAFFFIDVIGRRKSLFVGASLQGLTHVYIGTYLYLRQSKTVHISKGYSQSAVAALFIHALGYSIGLYTLPYVFGSELWPNHLRAFGAAFSGVFHWAFIYAIKYALPSILSSMHNFGAFYFYGGCCFLAVVYVYFVVPEVAGLSVEEIEKVFEGPWYKAYKRSEMARGSAADVETPTMEITTNEKIPEIEHRENTDIRYHGHRG